MTNLTDITHLTDAALDVVLEARAGADFVPCDHLTSAERYQVATALRWPMDARTRAWCSDAPATRTPADAAARGSSIDYEGMILDRQDEEENGPL